MIPGLIRSLDNLFGRGDAAVTVPPLDGALRANRVLDEAPDRVSLDGVDCLAVEGATVLATTGKALMERTADSIWTLRHCFPTRITSIAALETGGLAIALDSGTITIDGGPLDGQSFTPDPNLRCITAMVCAGGALYLTNGSATNGTQDWTRDLMERNASGSFWRLALDTGATTRLADGLGWPAGVAVDDTGAVVSEAWKHRLLRFETTVAPAPAPQAIQTDLPGYPGRISAGQGGYWLTLFAPRSQLVEFVLREPAYRRRMMAEVAPEFWVVPKLRSGRSFYESLQGGGVKQLGLLKPWAPTMSAGLCVRLDRDFRPQSSLQSRADGQTHGVTSAVEQGGRLFVAASGDGVIVSLPLTRDGGAPQ